MSQKHLITSDMSIADVMKRFPRTEETFIKYKLHCVGCGAAPLETIEVAAATHRLKDLNQLLDDLNAAVQ
jgi:hybrid cluster-associated redox disulfide protein